jgi:hypothetical protein
MYKDIGECNAFEQPKLNVIILGKAMNKYRHEFEYIGYCRELNIYLFGSSLKDYPAIKMCDEYTDLDDLEKDIDWGKTPGYMTIAYSQGKENHKAWRNAG